MDLSRLNRILSKSSGPHFIISEGEVKYVIMGYDKYEELRNGVAGDEIEGDIMDYEVENLTSNEMLERINLQINGWLSARSGEEDEISDEFEAEDDVEVEDIPF